MGGLPAERERGRRLSPVIIVRLPLPSLSNPPLPFNANRPSGTFLTAHPSGVLSASTPSRGPLESFTPVLASPSSPSSSSPGPSASSFPSFRLQTQAGKYITYVPGHLGHKPDLRADADAPDPLGGWSIKCQREFVLKARREQEDREAGPLGVGAGRRRDREEGQGVAGGREDEAKRK